MKLLPFLSILSLASAQGFSSASGLKFNIDGVTKYFAGTNSYWISFLTNNADVDKTLDEFKSSGLNILRVWGFNDVNAIPGAGTVYYQALVPGQPPEINTGANGLQRMDYIVKGAEKRGIKLIINFINNWDDYGGMKAYMRYFANGADNTGWYKHQAAQKQYRAYIRAVVSRYKDSPAVFAWELANEPRCKGCDTSVVTNWAAETSRYVKSLDPKHMVTLGDEGFGLAGDGSYPYQYGEGVDFVKNLAIPTLDFGTFHFYPESWSVSNEFGTGWVQRHAAACAAAKKPCLFEEYGSTKDHCRVEAPWQQVSRTTNGMAGDLFWQYGQTLSFGKTHDDGHTVYHGSSDWTCLVTNHVKAIG